ncbi:MAG: sortase [Terracoccus sp.]
MPGQHDAHGAVLASASLLAAGAVLVGFGLDRPSPPPQPPAVVAAVAATFAAPSPIPVPATHKPAKAKQLPPPAPFLPASQPVRLDVGSIGLRSADFVPLLVQRDGTLSVPVDADQVGFYADGPTPGQLGSAVLAAHVDTASGREGVFYRLGAVRRGDQIRVTRADGTTPVFTVDRVQGFSKSAFPTAAVYESAVTTSQLRLITCGGPLDGNGTYRDNVVVFAHLSRV